MARYKYIKVEDLVPGMWYTCKFKGSAKYTFKFSHFEDEKTFYRVFSSRYIQHDENHDKKDYFADESYAKSIVFADMKYVTKFYPHEVPQINNSYSII